MLPRYVPYQASSLNRTEPTIFEQVYGSRRRQPTAFFLNIQWVHVNHAPNIYESSGNDLTNRNLKKMTFFDTYAKRETRQSKEVTPPSSDYTDAYLAAFSPKLIRTRNIHRLTAPIFAHVEAVPLERLRTDLFHDDSTRTSSIRSSHPKTLNLFDRIQPFSPDVDSTYSSNLLSSSFTRHKPSSILTSSSCETITEPVDQTIFAKSLNTNQSEILDENTDKHLPSDSVSSTLFQSSTSPPSSSTKATYKPSVLFQSAIPSCSNDTQSIATKQQALSPSSTTEQRINQPETLLFRSDEDVALSFNEKSSQITTPSPELATTPIEAKLEPQNTLLASSKPIQILESTLNKYDEIISQISDILASVSPLSSTLSSLSPGQSVLDYELTTDGSPILHPMHMESQLPSQQQTTSVTNANASYSKAKYLIREDSYDKIVTAMTDLDVELAPLSHSETLRKVAEEENNETIKQLSSSESNIKSYEESQISLGDENDRLSPTKQHQDDHHVSLLDKVITEDIKVIDTQLLNEGPADNIELVQSGKKIPSSTVSHDNLHEATNQSYDEEIAREKDVYDLSNSNVISSKKNDESSSYQIPTEEINTLKSSILVIDRKHLPSHESSPIGEQQMTTSNNEDFHGAISDSIEPNLYSTDQSLKTFIPSDTLTSRNDSVNQPSSLFDTVDFRSDDKEHTISLVSSTDVQPIDDADISGHNTFPIDENSTVVPQFISQKDIINQQTVDDLKSTAITTSTDLSSQLIVNSPIETITNSISNRYISSDVYHGYQGEHIQANESLSNIHTQNTIPAHMISYRQGISSFATSVIEPVSCAVSHMQLISANEIEAQSSLDTVTEMIQVIGSNLEKNELIASAQEKIPTIDVSTLSSNLYEKSNENVINESIISSSSVALESETINDHISDTIIIDAHLPDMQDTMVTKLTTDIVVSESTNADINEQVTAIESLCQSSEFGTINDQTLNEQMTSAETHQNFLSMPQQNEYISTSEKSVSDADDQTQDDLSVSLTESVSQNKFSTDIENDSELISNFIQNLIDDTITNVLSNLDEYIIENRQKVPISNDNLTTPIVSKNKTVMKILVTEPDSDIVSMKTDIDNNLSKLPADIGESSTTNTEPNSSELVQALQNHSIVQFNPPQPAIQLPEKSSSSTTSSPVTSSDRYVSYAIHEMGDSSQDRLPTIPIEADIPFYRNDQNEPITRPDRSVTKEEDSTEFDATENLTSYTDDVFNQKPYKLKDNKQKDINAISTDDDADDEFENSDITSLHQTKGRVLETSSFSNGNDDADPCYDLATTPSSNPSSSSSRQKLDDVYLIPGYPGLWRPSASKFSSNSPREYDADDESRRSESQSFIRTTSSMRRPLTNQHDKSQTVVSTHQQNVISHAPLQKHLLIPSANETSLNPSESESYHTCQSSIPKSQKQTKLHQIHQSDPEDETSSDESILLIRERERGVSLPVTMKIDCDEIALRLSASMPIESHLYSTTSFDLPSPSRHSGPSFIERPASINQLSSVSVYDNEINTKAIPSSFNTTKMETETGTFDRPSESRVTYLKSAKGPISIAQCDPQGNFIVIENTSQSKYVDLTNWTLRQVNDLGDSIFFIFPDNYLLKPNQSLKVVTKTTKSEPITNDLTASSVSSWYTSSHIVTTLSNHENKERSTLIKKTILS